MKCVYFYLTLGVAALLAIAFAATMAAPLVIIGAAVGALGIIAGFLLDWIFGNPIYDSIASEYPAKGG